MKKNIIFALFLAMFLTWGAQASAGELTVGTIYQPPTLHVSFLAWTGEPPWQPFIVDTVSVAIIHLTWPQGMGVEHLLLTGTQDFAVSAEYGTSQPECDGSCSMVLEVRPGKEYSISFDSSQIFRIEPDAQ